MIDWIRDIEELHKYNSPACLLLKQEESVCSYMTDGNKISRSILAHFEVLGWMPVDVEYYNKWKEGEKVCETCAHGKLIAEGSIACGFPECAHGNTSKWEVKK